MVEHDQLIQELYDDLKESLVNIREMYISSIVMGVKIYPYLFNVRIHVFCLIGNNDEKSPKKSV